jgi:biotin carboxyl carrier protein
MAAYIVTHPGREHALRLHETRPGLYEVILDGRTITADCCAAGESSLSLIIDGRCYEADVDRTAGDDPLRVTISGHRFELDVVDDKRKRLARQRPAGLSGRQEVRAPMSGSLSQVLVSEGDPVAAGQVLMVLDAMKMANELAAPVAGVVGSLIARPGATVAASDLLCVVLPLNLEQRGAASAHRPPKDELPGRPGPS